MLLASLFDKFQIAKKELNEEEATKEKHENASMDCDWELCMHCTAMLNKYENASTTLHECKCH